MLKKIMLKSYIELLSIRRQKMHLFILVSFSLSTSTSVNLLLIISYRNHFWKEMMWLWGKVMASTLAYITSLYYNRSGRQEQRGRTVSPPWILYRGKICSFSFCLSTSLSLSLSLSFFLSISIYIIAVLWTACPCLTSFPLPLYSDPSWPENRWK